MRPRPAAIALVVVAVLAGSSAWAANDPGYKDQWGLHKVGAEQAWAGSTGAGFVVAVVDTGVDLDHPDLRSNLVPGNNFVEPGQPPHDDHGHGTHVAGIAAAVTNNGVGVAGMAPQAKIMPVRVLRKDGNGASGYVSDINAGVRWAADNGAHVVNLSLGEQVNLRTVVGSSLESSISYAWSKGAIPVISAGNDNLAILFPSGYRNVNAIVVGATNRNDQRASFSNDVGDAKWGMMAPGVDILSTWMNGGYATASGTSMSAPFVSGAAALVRARGLGQQQTVDKLLSTAQNVGSSVTYGHGRLDAAAAVGHQPSPTTPAPPSPGGSAGPGPGNGQPGSGPSRGTPPRTAVPQVDPGAPDESGPEEPDDEASPSETSAADPDATSASAAGPPQEPAGRRLANLLVLGVLIASAGGALVYLRLRKGT